ncbi:cytochrome b-c1 complex subunit 1, mitochondrial [Pteropus vampyrus]|uniref:Cytochrome b-c1 complex subunit 1, mitochondrial n=1 Tax=Pteropus vampyrus TaxID=132908 RepID=A0A6P6BMN2_PTEVA|nr:cytochrome b-c1 complex subunit 1, mitochondrial [Pteropus vampyrus]
MRRAAQGRLVLKMAASAVCRAASAGTRVLLCNRRSPALLKSPTSRSIATFAQALQNVPETQVSLLDNGLRVASEQSSQPTCTVGVWIDVGSRYESEKNNGAGYFVEHLAFKGTKNRPGSALEKEVETMGAHLNAYSTREHTAYYIKALSKDLPKAVELLADIVQNCSLEDSQIEKERDVVLQELQENDASLRDVVFDYLHATAFQGTPLAQAVEGPSENVRKLSRADLTEYLSQHYKAPRMVLAAAGGQPFSVPPGLKETQFGGWWKVQAPSLLPHGLASTTTVCEDIGRSLLTYGRRIPLTEWESRIAEVDAHAVREVCSKYFYDQCPAVAALGPIEQLPDYNRIRSGMFWLRF